MARATFNPKGVTATLINRVHRTGITMMTTIDKAQNKSESVNPKVIDDLETDYLLANVELENMLKSQLAQKNDESWKLFVDSVSKLGNEDQMIFRGVTRSIKQTAENILSNKPNPFFTPDFELPPYIIPYAPTAPMGIDPNFWKMVFTDAEKLEATGKGLVAGVGAVAGAIVVAAGGAAAAPVATATAAGCAAFEGGVAIGNAINHYMGWEEWK